MKNKPIKVCMLTTAFPRGKGDYAAPFVYDLCKKLVDNGIKVSVVAPHDPGARKYEEMDGIAIHRFQYMWPKKTQKLAYGIPHNIRTSFYAKVLLPFFLLSFIIKGLKVSRDCDIIHSQWMLSGFVGSVIKKFSNKKAILTPLGSGFAYITSLESSNNPSKFGDVLIKIMLDEIDLISVIYPEQVEKLREFGFDEKIPVILPLGVDTDKFKPKTSLPDMKKDLNVRGDFIIINTRRFTEQYRVDVFIESIPHVLKKIKNVKFILADSGPLQEKIEKRIQELGVAENVILMGGIQHKDMPKFFATSDVYVETFSPTGKDVTKVRGGIGQATREAMACGIPPLLPDWDPRLSEKNQKIVLLYRKLNSKDLAEKIVYLLQNPQIREKIGTNARQHIKETADMNIIIQKWIEKYKELTNN